MKMKKIASAFAALALSAGLSGGAMAYSHGSDSAIAQFQSCVKPFMGHARNVFKYLDQHDPMSTYSKPGAMSAADLGSWIGIENGTGIVKLMDDNPETDQTSGSESLDPDVMVNDCFVTAQYLYVGVSKDTHVPQKNILNDAEDNKSVYVPVLVLRFKSEKQNRNLNRTLDSKFVVITKLGTGWGGVGLQSKSYTGSPWFNDFNGVLPQEIVDDNMGTQLVNYNDLYTFTSAKFRGDRAYKKCKNYALSAVANPLVNGFRNVFCYNQFPDDDGFAANPTGGATVGTLQIMLNGAVGKVLGKQHDQAN